MVRMPEGMRDQIAEAAKANNRSMNAEIVARLELTFGGSMPQADLLEEVAADAADKALVKFMQLIGPDGWKDIAANADKKARQRGATPHDRTEAIVAQAMLEKTSKKKAK